jgi:hypothetical protein
MKEKNIIIENRIKLSQNPFYKYVFEKCPRIGMKNFRNQFSLFVKELSDKTKKPIDENLYEELRIILQELDLNDEAEMVSIITGGILQESNIKTHLKILPENMKMFSNFYANSSKFQETGPCNDGVSYAWISPEGEIFEVKKTSKSHGEWAGKNIPKIAQGLNLTSDFPDDILLHLGWVRCASAFGYAFCNTATEKALNTAAKITLGCVKQNPSSFSFEVIFTTYTTKASDYGFITRTSRVENSLSPKSFVERFGDSATKLVLDALKLPDDEDEEGYLEEASLTKDVDVGMKTIPTKLAYDDPKIKNKETIPKDISYGDFNDIQKRIYNAIILWTSENVETARNPKLYDPKKVSYLDDEEQIPEFTQKDYKDASAILRLLGKRKGLRTNVLYRGISLGGNPNFQEGQIIPPNLESWTQAVSVAARFSTINRGIPVLFVNVKPVFGTNIKEFAGAHLESEQEVISFSRKRVKRVFSGHVDSVFEQMEEIYSKYTDEELNAIPYRKQPFSDTEKYYVPRAIKGYKNNVVIVVVEDVV